MPNERGSGQIRSEQDLHREVNALEELLADNGQAPAQIAAMVQLSETDLIASVKGNGPISLRRLLQQLQAAYKPVFSNPNDQRPYLLDNAVSIAMLKRLNVEYGLKFKAIASELKCTGTHISHIMSGTRLQPRDFIVRLQSLLGKQIGELQSKGPKIAREFLDEAAWLVTPADLTYLGASHDSGAPMDEKKQQEINRAVWSYMSSEEDTPLTLPNGIRMVTVARKCHVTIAFDPEQCGVSREHDDCRNAKTPEDLIPALQRMWGKLRRYFDHEFNLLRRCAKPGRKGRKKKGTARSV
jgi:hypothetical protein